MKNKQRKLFASLLLGGLVVLTVFPILFFPKPAHAQFTDIPHTILQAGKWIVEQFFKLADKMDKVGAGIFFRNGINLFLQDLATNTATWIATGGKEGGTLFLADEDYWTKMADSMAANYLDQIAKNFVGFSVCEPIDPTIKLNILLSLPVPKPSFLSSAGIESRCSLSNIRENIINVKKERIIQLGPKIDESGPYYRFSIQIQNEIDQGEMSTSFIELKKRFDDITKLFNEYIKRADDFLTKAQTPGVSTSRIISMKESSGLDLIGRDIEGAINNFDQTLSNIKNNINNCEKLSASDFCLNDKCSTLCSLKHRVNCFGNFSGCLEDINKQNKFLIEAESKIEDILNDFNDFKETLNDPTFLAGENSDDVLDNFKKQVRGDNPISTISTLKDFIQSNIDEKINNSKFLQSLKGEWKPTKSLISDKDLFPAGIVRKKADQMIDSGEASPKIYTGVAIADAVGIFTQTLYSKLDQTIKKGFGNAVNWVNENLLDKTWEELFNKAGQVLPESNSNDRGIREGSKKTYSSESPIKGPTEQELKAIYADVLNTPLKKGEEIRLINEFVKCPSDSRYALPNNCVVDTAFSRAVEQEMTIEEAIEKNYLHGDWYVSAPLSHAGDVDSKKDFSKKYSLTNATILAQAGIMPLGFQIAADEISRNPALANEKFTLKQIVDGFSQYGKDNICGSGDPGESPFCNLVNPQWRLKDFPAQCDLIGYSSIPQPNSLERQEACLQWRTCTGEKDDGTCHTWNYCTAYKNTWRFNADACQRQYDTCQSYTRTSDKAKFNWLASTLDNNCDASGVGCRWYCQSYNKNFGSTESWDCAAPNKKYQICDYGVTCNLVDGCNCNNLCTVAQGAKSCLYQVNDIGNTIFLNRLTETCSNANQGCTEFIRTKENLGTNLFANSSFETFVGTISPVVVTGWQFYGEVTDPPSPADGRFILDETQAMDGKVFAQFDRAGDLYPSEVFPQINLLVGNKYSLSFYAKNKSEQAKNLTFTIGSAGISKTWSLTANSGWQLLVYEFTLPVGVSTTVRNIKFESTGGDILIDYLKLENGKASNYQDYGVANLAYLKKAPDYLSCYDGDKTNDDPTCLNFVQACSISEVGCEKYTPTNGDPYIPAVAKDVDTCPTECSGYNSFRERATAFYSDRDVNLISRTASVCSASEVGCEGYTNLEEVGRGAEGREYYSSLRACQKPDSNCGNFYTWVGSENSGFELKRYNLRKDEFGAPATILSKDVAEKIWGQCEDAEDTRLNFNCKEFYSENGNTVYYQLYRNTIVCNDTCLQLRKNKAVSASTCWPSLFVNNDPAQNQPLIEGLSFTTSGGETCEVDPGQQTCLTTKGEVCDLGVSCGVGVPGFGQGDPNTCTCQTGICTLTTLPQESIKCSSVNEDCREYKGNNANTVRVSFLDDFESGTYYPWQPLSSSGADYSNDSVYFGGHSLKIVSSEAIIPGATLGAEREVNGSVYTGKFYLISFLVKGSFADQVISAKFLPSNISFNNVEVQRDWQLVTLGPVYFNQVPSENEKIQITSQNIFWLDNIQLKDTGSLYLIKNSWTTPTTCSLEMIGCAEYRNRLNESKYFKSFSQICSDKVIGCEALVNTQNSFSAFAQKFNNDQLPLTDDVTVLGDQMEYLVYDKAFFCSSNDKGCQKLGLPNLTENGQVTIWGDVFLKNNPDNYTRKPILCREKDQGCEEFISSSGGISYLKDPGAKECEWREKVTLGLEIKTGWFKKGTDQPCYENYTIRLANSSEYQGYAGVCPSTEISCAKFNDPLATSGYVNPRQEEEGEVVIYEVEGGTLTGGGSYYYLDNFKINKSACNGKISLEKGCVLLNNVQSGDNLYNSIASYAKSKDLNGELISPISCDASAAPFKVEVNEEGELDEGEVSQSCSVGQYASTDYCNYCVKYNQTTNDTNLILKVSPTRVCAEWLHCKNKTKIWQKEANDYIEVCNEMTRCQQQQGEGDESTCTKIISPENTPYSIEKYKNRSISWSDFDFGGYKIYNWRPIDLLTTKIGTVNNGIVSVDDQLLLTSYLADGNACSNNQACTSDPKICYYGKCLKTEVGVSYSIKETRRPGEKCPNGSIWQKNNNNEDICISVLTPQAFPEKDSPFNAEISKTFSNINVCSLGVNDERREELELEVLCSNFKGDGDACNSSGKCEMFRRDLPDGAINLECLVKCSAITTVQECENYSNFYGCIWYNSRCVRADCNLARDQLECVGTKINKLNYYIPPYACYMENDVCVKTYCDHPWEQQSICESKPYCIWNQNAPDNHPCRAYACTGLVVEEENESDWQYFSCQLNYKKAEYNIGGVTKKYFNFNVNSYSGVCVAGDKNKKGNVCTINQDCSSVGKQDGQCDPLNQETTYYAKSNFCLNQDFSMPDFDTLKACNLWYPSARLLIPSVTTLNYFNPGGSTVTLEGVLEKFGASLNAEVWFAYRKTGEASWYETTQQLGEIGVPFEVFVDENLEPGNQYQYQARASNNNGTAYGKILTFNTLADRTCQGDLAKCFFSSQCNRGSGLIFNCLGARPGACSESLDGVWDQSLYPDIKIRCDSQAQYPSGNGEVCISLANNSNPDDRFCSLSGGPCTNTDDCPGVLCLRNAPYYEECYLSAGADCLQTCVWGGSRYWRWDNDGQGGTIQEIMSGQCNLTDGSCSDEQSCSNNHQSVCQNSFEGICRLPDPNVCSDIENSLDCPKDTLCR